MSSAFQLKIDSDGIGTLVFDLPNEKVNKFTLPVLEELEGIVDDLAKRNDLKVLVVRSPKPGIFIAGADLQAFAPAFKDPALLEKFIRSGHRAFRKFELLPFPTIALINGACVGGGLEFALGFNYRIATDNPKTSLGLPEVTLGLIPGWGGTQRLPRLVGLTEGLGMILPGKLINSVKAYKIHLVDAVIPVEFQEEKLQEFISLILIKDGKQKILSRRNPEWFKYALIEGNPIGRSIVYSKAKKEVLAKTKGHYPAPLLALEVIKETYSLPLEQGLEKEIQAVLKNVNQGFSQALNLINLFFTQEALKKDPGVSKEVKPSTITSIGVLGAGTMGASISWLMANADYPVRMKDVNWELLGKGFSTIRGLFNQGLKYKKITPSQLALKFQKVMGTVDYTGFKNVDFVIEAATENVELKNKIFQEVEGIVRPDAIITSNTSSLTITEMSKGFQHPERLVGMHFFNPVHKMPLVEVVAGEKTSPQAVATVVDLCKKIGKTPIVVGDCPGFLVNRIFVIGANEVLRIFQEGIAMDRIEKIFLDFGMPMSPFLLSDEVGNDVSYKVTKALEAAYGERMKCPELLQWIYEHKLYGKKTGKGFYIYKGKEFKPNPEIAAFVSDLKNPHVSITDQDIKDRMILSMVNEAARCLDEKIVASPAYLDIAMIMGIGFPPFRGGLLKYADDLGIDYVISQLNRFSGTYGPRFTIAPYLLAMQTSKNQFYQKERS